MAKIDQMPEYRANLPRTGHNLSHDFGFTCAPAHLLPVFHDFVNAGETVTLGFDFNLRTQPLDSAAMSKLKTHTEYFFVPMQLLYQGFSDWYYGIREEFSSRFSVNGELANFTLPTLDLKKVMKHIYDQAAYTYWSSGNLRVQLQESAAINGYRLFDMLGFRAARCLDGTTDDSTLASVFPYQILAYNCIYQNYYRLDTRELFQPNSFNVDYYFNTGSISDTDFAKYCMLHYRPFDNDYFNDIKVSPIVDVLNLNNKSSFDVANQYLTRGNVLSSGYNGSDDPFAHINPSSNIQTQFGMKYKTSDGEVDLSDLSVGINGNYFKQVSSFPPNDGDALFDPVAHPGALLDGDDDIINHIHSLAGTDSASAEFIANGLDIGTANIRAMFASEKLWSVTGRAKKKYDDQTLAHFGFKVPHDPKHEITCFGHDISEIHIGEVISTANTGDTGSPLGEIAGKGYGAQGGQRHKFTAPCHGVIMAIFSVVPEEYYQDTFLKANKLSDRSDLYTPEYDHLGMQPLFGYEVQTDSAHANDIVGWQYRYEQWKRRYNRVTSIFRTPTDGYTSGGSLSSWIHSIVPYAGRGSVEGQPNDSTNYAKFLHFPSELNDIMLVAYQTNYSNTYASKPYAVYECDPFVVNSHIDCVKVSTMSDYSLPRLDA